MVLGRFVALANPVAIAHRERGEGDDLALV
jgi:hypothetical protein